MIMCAVKELIHGQEKLKRAQCSEPVKSQRPANYFYEKHGFSNRLGEKNLGTRGHWALLEYSLVFIIDM